MTFGPTVRYPSSPITPLGASDLFSDRIPHVTLRSYDDSIVFNLMGPLATCDPLTPERVEIKELSGLIAPWKVIEQKGASQDGISFIDALYEPLEVGLSARAVGRDPAHLRKVVSDLVASIDIKKESELSYFTQRLGRWWAPVRWFKPSDNPEAPIQESTQELTLRLRSDSGFWQSYPNVDQFRFGYTADVDDFAFTTAPGDPVTGWTLAYSGGGSGVLYTDGDQAVSTLVNNKTVVARRTSYTSGSANQIVEIELGTNAQWFSPIDSFLDLWVRMNNTGTAGNDGIRCRIGYNSTLGYTAKFSSFTGGSETLIREVSIFYGPSPAEKFRLMTGDNPATYSLLRNGALVATVEEPTASFTDASHRKAGFGMSAASGSTVRPIAIRNWSVGDNATVAQEGFVQRINVGDQPMWDRFTCFGPGTFFLGNGPSSSDTVKFGPLLPNQIMQVRTDPRKYGIIDMTKIAPSVQELNLFEIIIQDYLSFLGFSRAAPQAAASVFGVVPPQGNPYSLLDGRFSVPVPPRSPGKPVQMYQTKVSIEDGNADSQIIVAGTPLRRLPY